MYRPYRGSVALLLALVFLGWTLSPAWAHRPQTAEAGMTVIPNTQTSFAFYRVLTVEEPVHLYTFEGQAGAAFNAGINIPQIAGLEVYGVSLALLGPGLPPLLPDQVPSVSSHSHAADAAPHAEATVLPEGTGQSGVVRASVVSKDFYEPFTQTHYWGRQSLALDLPQTGTYYLVVWHPDGVAGKYVLDTGREEVFGAGDLVRFPVWWLQTHHYFGHTPYLVVGFLFVTLAGVALVRRWQRRSPVTPQS